MAVILTTEFLQAFNEVAFAGGRLQYPSRATDNLLGHAFDEIRRGGEEVCVVGEHYSPPSALAMAAWASFRRRAIAVCMHKGIVPSPLT